MVYALGELGAQLLTELGIEFANLDWGRKNREAGRPFMEHQLEIVDFYVALELSTRGRNDVRLFHPEQIIASSPERTRKMRNPFGLVVNIPHNDSSLDIAVGPDLVFGLLFPDGSRRCFMVEIDRGTMPVTRAGMTQSSFERKMRGYLSAHASGRHTEQLGWKTFRVLVVTTDQQRTRSMLKALREQPTPPGPGPSLFLFALRSELRSSNPLSHNWADASGRTMRLM